MKCPAAWVLVTLLQQLFFLVDLPPARSQRTHARQGIGRDPPIVKLPNQGSLMGREISLSRTQKVTVYLGIPYAQAPIGPLRFSAPATDPLPSWSGVRNASQYAPSCQQIDGGRKLHEAYYRRLLPQDLPNPGVSENCLFLNIFVPDGSRPPEGWPVMVYFHGGDFNTGTAAIWDASIFVTKQKVLVVTVAYRLNILGFFTTTDAEAPGNYGMLDQIAALDWIQKSIEFFDGSPSNVVIYGHSSGAISVGLHILSPLSRGKFAKAIAMSGDAINSVGSRKTELPIVDIIADKFGCYRRPTSALMQCLRRVDAAVLVDQSADIETWGPIVDVDTNNSTEPFLPAHPRDLLESGDVNSVPLIAGYTNNEQALAYIESLGIVGSDSEGGLSLDRFVGLITDEVAASVKAPDDNGTCDFDQQLLAESVLFYYKPHPPSSDQAHLRDRYLDLQTEKNYAAGLTLLAGKLARKEQRTFVYRFDYRPRTQSVTKDVPEWAGVPHMFELPFVWGLPYVGGIQWNAADKRMADVMMSMFAGFAKSGNPSQTSAKWESFQEDRPEILLIDKNIEMSDSGTVDHKALAFWNEYYPMVLEEATSHCCNVTNAAGLSSSWPAGHALRVPVLTMWLVYLSGSSRYL